MKKNKKQKLIAGTILAGIFFSFTAFAAEIDSDKIIQLVNQERERAGLGNLNPNSLLTKSASSKAEDMLKHDYFSHTSPDGITPWFWFDSAGYSYKYAGENLAMDFQTADAVVEAWMKSPTHRDNILSSKYSEIGISVVEGKVGGHNTNIAVQHFGLKSGSDHTGLISTISEGLNAKPLLEEVSLRPWYGQDSDELLAYAKFSGKPDKVEISLNNERYPLEKIREDVYMSLIIADVDKLGKTDAEIVASEAGGKEVKYPVSKEAIVSAETKGGKPSPLSTTIAGAGKMSGESVFSEVVRAHGILGIIVMVLMIMIVNVWAMEKEEERLIAAMSH